MESARGWVDGFAGSEGGGGISDPIPLGHWLKWTPLPRFDPPLILVAPERCNMNEPGKDWETMCCHTFL